MGFGQRRRRSLEAPIVQVPMGRRPRRGRHLRARCPAGHQAKRAPGSRPDLVPRPRLAQRLDEAADEDCPGLHAGRVRQDCPAGRVGPAQPASVAWLSLDAGDNDPARFWRHTVAALDRVRPGISERMGPLLGPPPPAPSFEPLVTALINEVAGQAGRR